MTDILTFPASGKALVSAAQLASIHDNCKIKAKYLGHLRDRLVDVNNHLKASRSQIVAGLANTVRSLDFDKPQAQSEFGEQGAG